MENSFFSIETMQAGFSVAVAAFLLIRLENRVRSLTDAINQLRTCQVCKFKEEPGDLQAKAF